MTYRDLYLATDPLVTNIRPGQKALAKILGVPFDATATYRPGARFGPNAIREAFLNIEIYSPRLNIDLEDETVEDMGNLRVSGETEETIAAVSSVVKEVMKEGSVVAVLGGEHSITLGCVRSLPDNIGLLVFDAHFDVRDEFLGLRVSHATYLRRLLEENDGVGVIHVGARAASKDEWEFVKKSRINSITYYGNMEFSKIKNRYHESLRNFDKIYASIDLDVLDPAFAPGVSNPESAGLSTHQLLDLIYALEEKEIVGFDIVELCPPCDNGSASVAAAKVLGEMLSVIGAKRRAN